MAVTADQLIVRQGVEQRRQVTLAAAKTLYSGTLVFIDSNGRATDVTSTGSNKFAGVAADRYDNSGGAAGAIDGEVITKSAIKLTGSGFTQATVGVDIYASDNYTITATSTNNTKIGKCSKYVSATEIWVELEGLSG